MRDTTQHRESSSGAKVVSILMMIGALLALLPAAYAVLMSVMIFDAPGSTSQAGPWVFAISIWLLPLALLLTIVTAARNLGHSTWGRAGRAAGWTIAWVVLFFIGGKLSGMF